jgi:hypothetical protein
MVDLSPVLASAGCAPLDVGDVPAEVSSLWPMAGMRPVSSCAHVAATPTRVDRLLRWSLRILRFG